MALSKDNMTRDIVIVGGGMSGISCAFHLKKLGFENVTILEGRDRVGGRIHTIMHDSKPLEMGAQWIHGENGNVIHEIALKNGLVDMSAPNYMENISRFPNFAPDESKIFYHVLKSLLQHLESNTFPSPSVETTIKTKFEDLIFLFKKNGMECYIESFYKWFCNILCELEGCEKLTLLSPKSFQDYVSYSGNPTVELKYGYIKVLNLFLDAIPKEWIVKHKTVSKINWSRPEEDCDKSPLSSITESNSDSSFKPIEVICDDGSIYKADHVVTTISLGCLKANSATLFSPSLPQSKLEAINCLGFGSVNKIYLEFETPFWNETDIFNILFRETFHNRNQELDIEGHWYANINRFAYVPNHPKLLCAWVTGAGSVLVENLPVEVITNDCVKLLHFILQIDIPVPINVIMSKWSSDPFSQGSYSYPSVNCDERGVSTMDLAEPVFVPKDNCQHMALLFAGEASHPHCYGTVHAAYETGIREAHRLYSYYCSSAILPPPIGCHKKMNVVIVGAGVAGLSSARQLLVNGTEDILVLEAQHRIGGRTFTVPHAPSHLELGAQWIHGESGNSVYDFCKTFELIVDHEIALSEGKGIFCTSDGAVIPQYIVDDTTLELQRIKEEISHSTYEHGNEPQSVVEVFQYNFQDYIISCDDRETESLKWAIFKWFIKFETVDNACDNLNDITTVGFSEWSDSPGYFYTNLKTGYISFIERLIAEFPGNMVRTSKPVKRIHWKKEMSRKVDGSNKQSPVVAVECVNGDFYAANAVIVTTSVGYMKSCLHTFFSPEVPDKKSSAIASIGYGTINKVFLEFQERFWTDNELGFQFVWLPDAEGLDEFLQPETKWVFGITGFDRVLGQPKVLVAWIGGQEARDIEVVSDDTVLTTCFKLLKMFVKRPNISMPIKTVRSSWNSNPYIKGAYSYRPKKFYDSGCNVRDLVEPLYTEHSFSGNEKLKLPSVLFAGEATSQNYFSTVHGAFNSGVSSANSVMICLEQLKLVKDE